ncbi:hypothetical protein [Paremcibacter congregatus]|uniref:hypothetical protein n=1 Tax=Paremcibacter congregatus TaxID=2043170 RepID=UPI0030EB37BB
MSDIDAPHSLPLRTGEGPGRVTRTSTTSEENSPQQQSTGKRSNASSQGAEAKELSASHETAVTLSTSLSNLDVGTRITARYIGVDAAERPLLETATGTYSVKFDPVQQQKIDKIPQGATVNLGITRIEHKIEARLSYIDPKQKNPQRITLPQPVTLELTNLGTAPPLVRPAPAQSSPSYQANDLFLAGKIALESADKAKILPTPGASTNYTLYERARPEPHHRDPVQAAVRQTVLTGNVLLAQEKQTTAPQQAGAAPASPATAPEQITSSLDAARILHRDIPGTVVKNITHDTAALPRSVRQHHDITTPLDGLNVGQNFTLQIESLAVPDQHSPAQVTSQGQSVQPPPDSGQNPAAQHQVQNAVLPPETATEPSLATDKQILSGIVIDPGPKIIEDAKLIPSPPPAGIQGDPKTLYVATSVSVVKVTSPLELAPGTVITFSLVDPLSPAVETDPVAARYIGTDPGGRPLLETAAGTYALQGAPSLQADLIKLAQHGPLEIRITQPGPPPQAGVHVQAALTIGGTLSSIPPLAVTLHPAPEGPSTTASPAASVMAANAVHTGTGALESVKAGQSPSLPNTPVVPDAITEAGKTLGVPAERILHQDILATVIKNIPGPTGNIPDFIQQLTEATGPLDALKNGQNITLRIEALTVPASQPAAAGQPVQSAQNPPSRSGTIPAMPSATVMQANAATSAPVMSGIIIDPGKNLMERPGQAPLARQNTRYADGYSPTAQRGDLAQNEFKTLYVATPVSVMKFKSPVNLEPGTVISFSLPQLSNAAAANIEESIPRQTAPLTEQKQATTAPHPASPTTVTQAATTTTTTAPNQAAASGLLTAPSQETQTPQPLTELITNWQSLSQIAATLPTAEAAEASRALLSRIPSVQNPAQMTSTMVFFLAAMGARNPARTWLGPLTTQALEKAGQDKLIKRLDHDMQRISRLAASAPSGEWRPALLPLQVGGEITAVPILTRHLLDEDGQKKKGAGGDEDSEKTTASRFVVEVTLSQFGPVQVDGMLSDKRLSIIIRAGLALPQDLKQKVGNLFTTALEISGYTGDIQFRDQTPLPMSVQNIINQKIYTSHNS